jgi:hypothetical protein
MKKKKVAKVIKPVVAKVSAVCPHCESENVIVEAHPQLENHKVRGCLSPHCKRWDAIVPQGVTA